LQPLLRRIEQGEIDPSFVITHRMSLEEAPTAYRTFRDKQSECIKVVLDPWKHSNRGTPDAALS
jgi:threonine dehydrogenase-like Zn-dependent dehydrogenase